MLIFVVIGVLFTTELFDNGTTRVKLPFLNSAGMYFMLNGKPIRHIPLLSNDEGWEVGFTTSAQNHDDGLMSPVFNNF